MKSPDNISLIIAESVSYWGSISPRFYDFSEMSNQLHNLYACAACDRLCFQVPLPSSRNQMRQIGWANGFKKHSKAEVIWGKGKIITCRRQQRDFPQRGWAATSCSPSHHSPWSCSLSRGSRPGRCPVESSPGAAWRCGRSRRRRSAAKKGCRRRTPSQVHWKITKDSQHQYTGKGPIQHKINWAPARTSWIKFRFF